MRGGAVAARRAHNPKVPSSNLGPATDKGTAKCLFSFKTWRIRTRTWDPGIMSPAGMIHNWIEHTGKVLIRQSRQLMTTYSERVSILGLRGNDRI
jgi:hypothetical protein